MQQNYILLPVIKEAERKLFYCELKEEVNSDVLQEAFESDNRNISYVFNGASQLGLFPGYLEPCNLRTDL